MKRTISLLIIASALVVCCGCKSNVGNLTGSAVPTSEDMFTVDRGSILATDADSEPSTGYPERHVVSAPDNVPGSVARTLDAIASDY